MIRRVVIVVGIALTIFSILCFTNTLFIGGTYIGQEVFTSEQEYQYFKNAIVENNALVIDIDVLSSDPPIIVNYEIDAEYFPYGLQGNTLYNEAAASIFIGLVILFFCILFIIKDKKEVSNETDKR